MKTVEHRIFNIGRTAIDRTEAAAWLEDLGVSEEAIQKLLDSDNTDAATLVRLAGKRCYMAFEVGLNPNISKVREDMLEYIDHVLASKHGSVIEHCSYTFAIEGISRVLTAELNRHRAGVAISEGSMRFIRFDDLPYWLPHSIGGGFDNGCRTTVQLTPEEEAIESKKAASREVFERAFRYSEKLYRQLEEIWSAELAPESKFSKKKEITSMMRRIIPIGVSTGGVWSFNLRALRHVCTMRVDPGAEEEISSLALQLLNKMMTAEVNFFGDFTKNEKGAWRPKHEKV